MHLMGVSSSDSHEAFASKINQLSLKLLVRAHRPFYLGFYAIQGVSCRGTKVSGQSSINVPRARKPNTAVWIQKRTSREFIETR